MKVSRVFIWNSRQARSKGQAEFRQGCAKASDKEVPMIKLRPTVFVASAILALATIPANAMSMPSMTIAAPPSTPIIQVRDHGHHYGHRFDGRHWHGNDHYYDNDDVPDEDAKKMGKL